MNKLHRNKGRLEVFMDTPQVASNEPLQTEKRRPDTEPPIQKDEIAAWEPIENDLWIPYRIRGSWRGGVLG
jgi:hypothetical protein